MVSTMLVPRCITLGIYSSICRHLAKYRLGGWSFLRDHEGPQGVGPTQDDRWEFTSYIYHPWDNGYRDYATFCTPRKPRHTHIPLPHLSILLLVSSFISSFDSFSLQCITNLPLSLSLSNHRISIEKKLWGDWSLLCHILIYLNCSKDSKHKKKLVILH